MRKNYLRQYVDQYCQHNHAGSYRSRKHRHFVLHKVIRDLFHTGSVPPKWHAVTDDDIQRLVHYWQQEKIAPPTIMKYMTIIRHFFQQINHTIPAIDNKTMGIIRRQSRPKKVVFSDDIFKAIVNPMAKLLLEYQVYFGLTFSEAMHLHPHSHFQENAIWITRDIASNSHDRLIPIRTTEQRDIIDDFYQQCPQHPIITTYGYGPVHYHYHTELTVNGLPTSKRYRYVHAQQCHAKLSQQLSPYLTKQTIMREMGIRSRRTLWRYLHE